jgi:sulfatase maturation enzyme AslB (radical SAM superfamily)
MVKSHRPVQVLIKPASADCNLACAYCFYCEKSALYPDTPTHRMSPDVQEEMVKQILRYGGETPAFAYQGGEPTLLGLDTTTGAPWPSRCDTDRDRTSPIRSRPAAFCAMRRGASS